MEEKHSRKAFAGKRAGKLILLALLILGVQAATKSCSTVSVSRGQESVGQAMVKSIWEEVKTLLYSQFMPGIAFMEEGGQGTWWLLREGIDCLFPFYGYLTAQQTGGQEESAEDIRTILLAEAGEETAQMEETQPEDILPDVDAGLAEEEGTARKDGDGQAGTAQEDLADLLRAENQAAMEQRPGVFLPHEKQVNLDLEPLSDYETLIQQFYTVDANTVAGSDQLDVHKLMGQDMTISKDAEGPQILIYHTHAHEEFADSTPGDMSETIMGVGERLTTILTEEYGYQVLHHLGQYDTESRDDSYAVALGDLEALLQQYPSIQVVIDLHRDAMPEGTRLVMDLDGRPTARFMFFNGLSRTKKTGNISYLYNENLDSNLAFSFQMQKTAMEYYPNLTRRIYLRGYRYNMHLRPKSLLIELGAQNNTLEEVMNACDPLAHILDLVLSGSGQSGNAPAE
ncbi:MAG: stage II sporulation protein P [Lachnospiraceae bacterium]|nr:stage II sporulation protein P [uncultured Acetatifactor sp.]MCI9574489.1 stage II sporulation protein P [Lachnospiraceae bacterium]